MSNGEDDVKKQIDEMLDINLDEPRTEVPTTDEPQGDVQTDPPTTEQPVEDEYQTDPPVTDEPKTEPPKTEPPTTDAPKVDYEEELRSLRAELEEIKGKKKPPATSPPATTPPLEEIDFIGDDDPDNITRDKAALNKLLNKVFSKGVETGVSRAEEGVLRKVPDLVKKTTALASTLRKATDEFYSKNKDLLKFKKVCGTVFEELVSDNPDWTYEKALEETGKEVRKRLELKPSKTSVTNKDRDKPTFPRRPKGSRGRQQVVGKTKTDSLLSEIDQMNKL